jgi:ferrochelatase
MSMADNCKYERQLTEASRLVAEAVGHARWELVYQSRSGPPQQPWLEPDVCDHLSARHAEGSLRDVVVLPIGFVSDHMEVLYDLDAEARDLCAELGVGFQRAPTVGTHPRFVRMIRELIEERIAVDRGASVDRPALGQYPANHDVCPENCCLYTPQRPPGVGRPVAS